MTRFLRYAFTAAFALCVCAVAANAQAAFPGDPHSGMFPSAQQDGMDKLDAIPDLVHNQWSTVASLPEPKIYNMVASLDGKIYSFGGYAMAGGRLSLDASSYVYDPATDTWSQIADFPSSSYIRGHAHAVNGKIYIMGGAQFVSSVNDYRGVNFVYEYDPSADSYSVKASMPQVQYFCASGVIDDVIYLFAGRSDNSYLTTVQAYDPIADQWSTAPDFPRPVMYLGSATADNKIVITGGYNANFSPSRYIADTYVVEIDNGTLTYNKVADYPIGSIIYPTGAGIGTSAYFTGGRPSAFGNAAATDWTFEYDLTAGEWNIQEKKITGVQNSNIASADGKIYAPGGEGADGIILSGAVEVFDPEAELPNLADVDKRTLLATFNENNPTPQTIQFTVHNLGPTEVVWDVAVDGNFPWLALGTNQGGTLAPYQVVQVEVNIDPSTLSGQVTDGALLLTSSSQALPEINIGVKAYMVDHEIFTEKNVLVEEFSGTWCGWCPYGVDSLKALEANFGDRVVIVTYHEGSNEPMVTQTGSEIIDYLEVSSYPSASIDRRKFNAETKTPVSRSLWGNAVRAVLDNVPARVGIEIKNKTYDEATKQLAFTAEVTFLQAVQGDYRLMMIQTNNQRNFAQVEYYQNSSGGTSARLLYPYMHDHVVETVLPDAEGFMLGDGSVIDPGTVFTQDYAYTSADSIPELSDLTLFVYSREKDETGAVEQAIFEPLLANVVSVQDPAVAGTFALEQNFPNPFNPSTTIRYNVPRTAQVKLVVTDILGREVAALVDGVKSEGLHSTVFNASGLQSGTYFITMTSGSFIDTKSMTLMK